MNQDKPSSAVSLFPAGSTSLSDHDVLPMIAQCINVIHHGLFILDTSYRAVFYNQYLLSLLGKTADDIIGKTLPEILAPAFPASENALKKWLYTDTQSNPIELSFAHPLYKTMWIALTIRPVYNQEEQLIYTLCTASNITSRKMQEALQYKAFNAIAKDAPVRSIMSLICQEVKSIIPDIIPAIYQFDQAQTIHTLSGPHIPDVCHATIQQFLNSSPPTHNLVIMQQIAYETLSQDDSWRHEAPEWLTEGLHSCWVSPVLSVENQVIGALIFYCRHQISPDTFHQHFLSLIPSVCALALEREQSRSQIHQLAYYDALTGLANRSLLKQKATEAIQEAQRTQTSLAIVFIDLDRFKQVNDSLGHHAGDELLRTIASRLQNESRHPSDIVCRLSGDEFVIVFTHCDRHRITEIARQIQASLTQPCHIKGVAITPSASLGISMYPDNGTSIDTLLNRADMAMYLAKKKLSGSFGFFSEEMNVQAQEKMAIENALRLSMSNKEFTLLYQPQIRFKDHQLFGVEALARWQNPQWEHIPTDRFIAIAEECGLIQEFTYWLLEETCRQMALWRKQRIPVPFVAINLSASNFHNTDLSRHIMDLLRQYQLSARDIVLEITETVLMDSNPDTMHNITTLHEAGILLCIDDFGTGYSSLSYLRQLPVSILKLDKSFIRDMHADINSTVSPLVSAIIRIGESLHLTVIAEGIETEHQYDMLNQLHCDVGQGYLFAEPLSSPQLADWITQQPAPSSPA